MPVVSSFGTARGQVDPPRTPGTTPCKSQRARQKAHRRVRRSAYQGGFECSAARVVRGCQEQRNSNGSFDSILSRQEWIESRSIVPLVAWLACSLTRRRSGWQGSEPCSTGVLIPVGDDSEEPARGSLAEKRPRWRRIVRMLYAFAKRTGCAPRLLPVPMAALILLLAIPGFVRPISQPSLCRCPGKPVHPRQYACSLKSPGAECRDPSTMFLRRCFRLNRKSPTLPCRPSPMQPGQLAEVSLVM